MLFVIRKSDNKDNFSFSTNTSPLENADLWMEGYYYHRLDLSIFNEDDKVKIADLVIYCFDIKKIEDSEVNLEYVADSINADVDSSMAILSAAKLIPDNVCEKPMLCYIDKLYIKPKFRHKGLGSWLMKNVAELIKFYYDKEPYGFVIYPRPLDGRNPDDINEKLDTTSEMYQLMVGLIVKNGFYEINETNYFFKKCEREI